jgi:hypothetical protein
MSNNPVSHAQAVEALRVITTMASNIAPAYPPFAYGSPYPMTPGNAAPALIVWLFLVTNPDYLDALDTPAASTSGLVPVQQIAAATNLTEACVQSILGVYTSNPASKYQPYYQSFRNVATAFQVFAADAQYTAGHCPGGAMPIVTLAQNGASVDPAATGSNS